MEYVDAVLLTHETVKMMGQLVVNTRKGGAGQ